MRLSHKDHDLVLKLLPDLYGAADLESFPEVGIALLQRTVPAERYSYNELSAMNNKARVFGSPKVVREDELLQAFNQHFANHPVIRHMLQTGRLGVGAISDFLTLRQFRQTGLYQDYYRKIDVSQQVSVYLENSPRLQIAFACNRSQRPFSERDKLMLECLMPHLRRAYQRARLFHEARKESDLLARALATSGQGVIALRDNLEVEWMTAAARTWLEVYGLKTTRGARALPDQIHEWLRAQLGGKSDRYLFSSRPLLLNRIGNQLSVRFRSNAQGQRWLILREQWVELPARLVETLGLSRREVDVLKWLVVGKSNAEIGGILHISFRTVEKHVERILAKLGVENRMAISTQVRELSESE